jgi:hypothetical protein
MFGEGRNDKDFIYALSELEKFKFHTKSWRFTYGNAHGGSAYDVLNLCKSERTGAEDFVLCFIDLDDLKHDYSQTWEVEKQKLENDSIKHGVMIIWFLDKLEEELRRVLGEEYKDHSAVSEAKKSTDKFINSNLWKRILNPIKECEDYLESLEQEKNESVY